MKLSVQVWKSNNEDLNWSLPAVAGIKKRDKFKEIIAI